MTPTLQDRAKEALDKIISLEGRTFSLEFEAETLYAGYLHRYFETIREALRLAADPDWVYVPRVPTKKMLLSCGEQYWHQNMIHIYTAMIAAAPVATTEGV